METYSDFVIKLDTRHQCNKRFYIEMNFSITLTTMPGQTCLEQNGVDSEYSAVFKGMCTQLLKLWNDYQRIPQNLYIIKNVYWKLTETAKLLCEIVIVHSWISNSIPLNIILFYLSFRKWYTKQSAMQDIVGNFIKIFWTSSVVAN